jgi:DNA helicase-2/ATP-dependent DNA helicase PcrA
MPNFTQALAEIARNERRFLGLDSDDRGFDPQAYRGKVTVTTMHKAKGLEWDRVYMLSVNTYDFPSGQPGDNYVSEKWYVRDFLNLEAESLAQLRALAAGRASEYVEGAATDAARTDYISERLRLLYVGITRARKELIVTWNTGRRGNQQAAVPFLALAAIESARQS